MIDLTKFKQFQISQLPDQLYTVSQQRKKGLQWNVWAPRTYPILGGLGESNIVCFELTRSLGLHIAQKRDSEPLLWEDGTISTSTQPYLEDALFFSSDQVSGYDPNRPNSWIRDVKQNDLQIGPYQALDFSGSCKVVLKGTDSTRIIRRSGQPQNLNTFSGVSVFVLHALIESGWCKDEIQKYQLLHGNLTSLIGRKWSFRFGSFHDETTTDVYTEEETEPQTFDEWFSELSQEKTKLKNETKKLLSSLESHRSSSKPPPTRAPPRSKVLVPGPKQILHGAIRDEEISRLKQERDEAVRRCLPDKIQEEQREIIRKLQEKVEELSLTNQGYAKQLKEKQDELARRTRHDTADHDPMSEIPPPLGSEEERMTDQSWLDRQDDSAVLSSWNRYKRDDLREIFNLTEPIYVSPIPLPS
jgi:hypothetical protein